MTIQRLIFLAGVLALVGGAGDAAAAGPVVGEAAPQAAIIEVSAANFMFSPTNITVKAGATVTWVNLDEEPHTVTSDAGVFKSPALDTREHFSHTFEKPGTYRYLCTLHPQMMGVVTVE